MKNYYEVEKESLRKRHVKFEYVDGFDDTRQEKVCVGFDLFLTKDAIYAFDVSDVYEELEDVVPQIVTVKDVENKHNVLEKAVDALEKEVDYPLEYWMSQIKKNA